MQRWSIRNAFLDKTETGQTDTFTFGPRDAACPRASLQHKAPARDTINGRLQLLPLRITKDSPSERMRLRVAATRSVYAIRERGSDGATYSTNSSRLISSGSLKTRKKYFSVSPVQKLSALSTSFRFPTTFSTAA